MRFLLLIFLGIKFCGQSEKKKKAFVPTHEWKVVESDQPIPAGLHVKMDLQTGKNMARLMESNQNDNSVNQLVLVKDQHPEVPERILSRKFRTLEEIKKELGEEFLATLKTEAQIFIETFQNFKLSCFNGSNLCINYLSQLAEMCSGFDHAVNFFNMKGFDYIIKLLHKEDISEDLCTISMKLLGNSVQNNEKVQEVFINKSFTEKIFNILSDIMEKNQPMEMCAASALRALKLYTGSCTACQEQLLHGFGKHRGIIEKHLKSGKNDAVRRVISFLGYILQEFINSENKTTLLSEFGEILKNSDMIAYLEKLQISDPETTLYHLRNKLLYNLKTTLPQFAHLKI